MLIFKLLWQPSFVFVKCSKSIASEGLSGIKVVTKCEVNQTSGFQDIVFTSNCGWTDRRPGGQTDRAIP